MDQNLNFEMIKNFNKNQIQGNLNPIQQNGIKKLNKFTNNNNQKHGYSPNSNNSMLMNDKEFISLENRSNLQKSPSPKNKLAFYKN